MNNVATETTINESGDTITSLQTQQALLEPAFTIDPVTIVTECDTITLSVPGAFSYCSVSKNTYTNALISRSQSLFEKTLGYFQDTNSNINM